MVEDLGLREHVSRVQHEIAQEVEFRRREVDGVAAPSHLVRALVELKVREPEHAIVLGLVAGAAQDGVHARDDLGQSERLGHVVVTADRETGEFRT